MADDWLLPALTALPVLLVSFLAVGIPWALVVLPRADWRDRVLVAAVACALGPVLWTTGMFLLGTFLRITLAGTVLAGAILVLWGVALVWFKVGRTQPAAPSSGEPLAWWERLIVIGLALAVILRVIHVAYWPFTAYDSLWVYGYNAHTFTLTGQIPTDMAYYPQLLPLSFTYAQLVWGGINDHAARMVIPFFALGSILAAYVLGARAFDGRSFARRCVSSRRVGLLTAALWTFYPHHAQWAQFGDLEVPLTMYFTLAAAFLIMAWREQTTGLSQTRRLSTLSHRWHYAIISGLMLGGAMWTKPTAGALVWSVLLLLVIEAIRVRLNWRRLWPKFQIAVVVGLASAPIGGMWYVRNVLLGHPAIIFPPEIWLTRAQRSGQELGWPLVILAVLALYLLLEPKARRPDWRLLVGGWTLMLLGALPSAGLWIDTPTHRLLLEEVAVIVVGLALYGLGVWQRRDALFNSTRINTDETDSRGLSQEKNQKESAKISVHQRHLRTILPLSDIAILVIALVAPYFMTWFYSYSYHPRLAFVITPLQLFLIAALGVAIMPRLAIYVRPERRATMAAIALLTLIVPGLWLTIADTAPHLLSGDLADDDAKQEVSNFAMFGIVEALREAEAEAPLHVVAPGALRLPFFFPQTTIDTDPVADLGALDDRVTHYVAGLEADAVYRAAGTMASSSARAVVGLPRLVQVMRGTADDDFWYEVYATNTALRFVQPFVHARPAQATLYPDFAELRAYGLSANAIWPGRDVVLTTHWRVFGRTDGDYTLYLHLTDGEEVYAEWDHVPGRGLYHTYFWEPGEWVTDEVVLRIDADVPPGDYQITAGLYDFLTGERLPVTLDGEAGLDGETGHEGVVLIEAFTVLSGPAE